MPNAKAQTDYLFSGVKMHCQLTGRETNGTFCLFENQSPGNSGTPVHSHAFEDETLIVFDGEMEAIIDGVPATLRPGQAIFLPRDIPHQLRNTSRSPSRYGILCTPSGFEEFVAEAGRIMTEGEVPSPPSPQDIQAMRDAAPHFGITLLPGFPAKF